MLCMCQHFLYMAGCAAHLMVHSLVDGHLGFQFLSIVDNAAMDILELSQ